MNEGELLLELRNTITELKQRQQLIDKWITHDDPELRLFGEQQKSMLGEVKTLITDLIAQVQTLERAQN